MAIYLVWFISNQSLSSVSCCCLQSCNVFSICITLYGKPLCLSVPSNNLGLRDFESLFSGWNVASTVMKGIFKVTSFFDIHFFWCWVTTFFSHYFWPTKVEKDTYSNCGKVQKQRKSQKDPIQILSHFWFFFKCLFSPVLCSKMWSVNISKSTFYTKMHSIMVY